MTYEAERRPRWRGLDTQEREREYSPSSMVADGDLGPYIDRYITASARARHLHPPVTVDYGPASSNTATQTIDHHQVADSELTHLFIHGGYWQELSKRESYFLAPACARRAESFAAVDYTLAPAATMAEIVAECAAAIAHLTQDGPVVVSGSSAGAHLAAAATLTLAPKDHPAALILVSGVYDLEPLVGTYINEAVGLVVDTARAASPIHQDPTGLPPTVVAWGEHETDEFKRQSRAMTDHLASAGVPVAEYEIAGRNHFDVVFDIVPHLVDLMRCIRHP